MVSYYEHLKNLYPEKISLEGLEKAVEKGLITEEEKEKIVWKE